MSETAPSSLLGKIAGYTEILSRDPRSTIFVPLAEAYRQMGLFDEALEIASKGVRLHPSFGPGYTALGRIQAQREARDEAVAAFEKALELDKDSIASLKGLANLRLQNGDMGGARLLLLRAAAIKPEDTAVRKILRRLNGTPSSLPSHATETRQAKNPQTSSSNLSSPRVGAPISTPTIAELYIKQGFPKRALKVYRDLLEADPHNEAIRQKLIALKKSLSEAERPAQQEISLGDAEDPASVHHGAGLAAKSGEYAEKLQLWMTSIQQRRKHVQ